MKLSAEQCKELYETLDALAGAIGSPKAIEALTFITGTVPVNVRHTRNHVVFGHDPDLQADARKVLFAWLHDRKVIE